MDKPFLMPIEDVFSITGRGTVGTGRVERGKVKVGDKVERVGIRETRETVVTGVEMFRKLMDDVQAGDNVGCCCAGWRRTTWSAGWCLCAPKIVTPHKKFKAEVYMLTKEEGGRHTPFFDGYRPQFYFRTTDVTGVAQAAGRSRDGDAGRQRADGDRADHADRDGEGTALRHPRGRSHRRRRRRHRRSSSRGARRNASAADDPDPLKSYDHAMLDKSAGEIVATARRTGAITSGPVPLPTKKTIYTVLRSPHVDKKSREQFEIRVHKRLIDITQSRPADASTR